MEKQLTAVEFLLRELKKYGDTCPNYEINYVIEIPTHILTELEEQAKQMEKEQIVMAIDNVYFDKDGNEMTGEDYYNTTFKSE